MQDRYDLLSRQRLMYDLMTLALKTDSTRVITFSLGAFNAVPTNIDGVQTDWHNLSHHGKDENKIDELEIIEKKRNFHSLPSFLGICKAIRKATRHFSQIRPFFLDLILECVLSRLAKFTHHFGWRWIQARFLCRT